MASSSIDTVIAVVQLVVIVVTAAFALAQLRQNRAANELRVLFSARASLERPEFARTLTYVQTELATRLADPAFCDELERVGFIDPERHPELAVLNWFSDLGILVQHRTVEERLVLELFGRLINYYWALLVPVVVLVRRNRDDEQFIGFEFLAIRAQAWLARARERRPRFRRGRLAADFPGAVPAGDD